MDLQTVLYSGIVRYVPCRYSTQRMRIELSSKRVPKDAGCHKGGRTIDRKHHIAQFVNQSCRALPSPACAFLSFLPDRTLSKLTLTSSRPKQSGLLHSSIGIPAPHRDWPAVSGGE